MVDRAGDRHVAQQDKRDSLNDLTRKIAEAHRYVKKARSENCPYDREA